MLFQDLIATLRGPMRGEASAKRILEYHKNKSAIDWIQALLGWSRVAKQSDFGSAIAFTCIDEDDGDVHVDLVPSTITKRAQHRATAML